MLESESTRPHEAGFVRPLDGFAHVVKRIVGRNVALCGAGTIETQLVGRFDPDAGDACPVCSSMLAMSPNR